MRRIFSIVLVAALGLPVFASAFTGADASAVPACCRKGGMHHCMMVAAAPGNSPAVRAVCPAFPRGGSSVPTTGAMMHPQRGTFAGESITPLVIGQGEDGDRIALQPTRWTRGPPFQI